jgi:hypothetical protein
MSQTAESVVGHLVSSMQRRLATASALLTSGEAGQQFIGPMPFLRQSIAATVLVTLTLSLQSAGMATLIHWRRARVEQDLHKLGLLRSAALVVQITLRLQKAESWAFLLNQGGSILHPDWVRKGRQGAPRLIDTPTENALRSLDQLRHLSRPGHRTGIGPPPPIAQVDRMGGCTSYLSFLDLPQRVYFFGYVRP